jgi:membrane protein YqaA with SNARE-associated domain
MLNWITNIISSLSYWGIALLMLLENILPPIPSEVIKTFYFRFRTSYFVRGWKSGCSKKPLV